MNYKGTQNDDDDGDDNDDGNNNNNNHETKQLFCYDNIKKKGFNPNRNDHPVLSGVLGRYINLY